MTVLKMISTYLSWTAFKGLTSLQPRAHAGALSTFIYWFASTLAIYNAKTCNIAGDVFVVVSTWVDRLVKHTQRDPFV